MAMNHNICTVYNYIILDINECSTNSSCKNGATCLNTIGGFQCSCASGFQGQYCEHGICIRLYLVPVFICIRLDLYSQPLLLVI